MAVYNFYYEDRMKSLTTSTGARDTVTLTTAPGPWRPITYANVGLKKIHYCMIHENGVEWEIGRGQMDSGDVMWKDAVISSSNADAYVNFTAGNKEVFVTFPANAIRDIQSLGERGGIPAPAPAKKVQTTSATLGVIELDVNTGGVRDFIVCAFSSTGGNKSKVWEIKVVTLPLVGTEIVTTTMLAQSESLAWTATYNTSVDRLEFVGAAATTVTWYAFERVLGRFE